MRTHFWCHLNDHLVLAKRQCRAKLTVAASGTTDDVDGLGLAGGKEMAVAGAGNPTGEYANDLVGTGTDYNGLDGLARVHVEAAWAAFLYCHVPRERCAGSDRLRIEME
jgi:hypothetical protein